MAEGGSRRPSAPHPFFAPGTGRPTYQRQLSRDDVGNQSRFLMTRFIHDRLIADGYNTIPQAEHLVEPGTPSGPPLEHAREVASALKRIGDQLDKDQGLQDLLTRVSPDSPKQTFLNVAREIFSDGVFNWGRVVALFYFAYKMIIKAIMKQMTQIPLFRSIVEWVVTFIRDYVAQWIIDRGGWEAIQEYFGATYLQMAAVVGGFVACTLFIIARRYL